jgi:hypothetical protein
MLSHIRVFAVAVLATGLALAFACESSSSASCDSVCDGVGDCGGTSCLAYCVELEAACTSQGAESAFSDWATCKPVLGCTGNAFAPMTCAVQVIETMACGGAAASAPGAPASGTGTGTGIGTGPVVTGSGTGTGTPGTGTGTGTGVSSGSSTGTTTGTSTGTGTGDASGVCAPIGDTCTVGTGCCSLYCKAGICACNTGGYACGESDDCCSGYVCNGASLCVGDANTVVTCQTCGGTGDAGACPGTRHCLSTNGGQTYCAQDCTTNANSCPVDMTCTADGTGTSSCIPNSGECVASADGGA